MNSFVENIIKENINDLFPEDRADIFFDALYGDISEGAYDISLIFIEESDDGLFFEFQLDQRPGKCLACNLTYGLPEVFSRSPIVDLKGIVRNINKLIEGNGECHDWELGATQEVTRRRHVIPVALYYKK